MFLQKFHPSLSLTIAQRETLLRLNNLIDAHSLKITTQVKKERHESGLDSTDDYLNEGIENLKLYYAIAFLDPLNYHAVSDKVDPFWHSHILHTRDYHHFCNEVFGEYAHHEPLHKGVDNASEVNFVAKVYDYTLEVGNKIYKPGVLCSDWWGKEKFVCLHVNIQNELLIQQTVFKKRKDLLLAV